MLRRRFRACGARKAVKRAPQTLTGGKDRRRNRRTGVSGAGQLGFMKNREALPLDRVEHPIGIAEAVFGMRDVRRHRMPTLGPQLQDKGAVQACGIHDEPHRLAKELRRRRGRTLQGADRVEPLEECRGGRRSTARIGFAKDGRTQERGGQSRRILPPESPAKRRRGDGCRAP